ncbi:MAG: outer membrane beta-barrel protein [bacterium]|nr:outer membrane beta-barrel protein [bacterium]
MKKLALLSAAVAVCASQVTFAALEPQGIDLEPFLLVPTVAVAYTQNSNIYGLSHDAVSSSVIFITPTLDLIAQDRDNLYRARYGLIAQVYGESDNNAFDHLFSVSAHIEPTGRFRFDLGAGYNLLHDNAGTGRTEGIVTAAGKHDPDTFSLATLNAAVDYGAKDAAGQIGLSLGQSQKRYDLAAAADSRDLDIQNAALEFRLRVMPKTRLLLDIEQDQGNYSNAVTAAKLDYTESRYLVGVSWEGSANTTGKVRVGNGKRSPSVGPDVSSLVWGVGVVWTPRARDSVTIDGSQAFKDGTFPTTSIDSRSLALGWSHSWADRWQSSLTAALGKDDHNVVAGFPARQDDSTTLGLALNYQMRRWFMLGAGATLLQHNSNLANFEYDRQIISLNAQLSL